MTSKPVIDWLHRKFGGRVNKVYSESVKQKHYWNWYNSCLASAELLRKIRPWLLEKRRQAEVFLEFASHTAARGTYGKSGYSPKVRRRREQLYRKMKRLNRKGRAK